MRSSLNVLAFVLVLIAGVAAGYVLAMNGQKAGPGAPTPAEDMIVIDAPAPGSQIASPLQVTGRARGNWYFEASFPVILKTAGGAVLATVPAQAQGDWMTTDWVPFTATLVFTPPAPGSSGTLILQKDNPSGEPQYDDSRTIPVVFQ
jgi:hypothetical protein